MLSLLLPRRLGALRAFRIFSGEDRVEEIPLAGELQLHEFACERFKMVLAESKSMDSVLDELKGSCAAHKVVLEVLNVREPGPNEFGRAIVRIEPPSKQSFDLIIIVDGSDVSISPLVL